MSALDDFNARARKLDIPLSRFPWAIYPGDVAARPIPLHVKLAYPAVSQFCGAHGFKGLTVEPTSQGILLCNGAGDSQTIPADILKHVEPDTLRTLTLQILDSLQITA